MLAVNLDLTPGHAAEIERRFALHAPSSWQIQSLIGGTIPDALALGADLILWPRTNVWGNYDAWQLYRDANVPVVAAHGSNSDTLLPDPPRLFWPVVVSADRPGSTAPVTSHGPGLELAVAPSSSFLQSWAVAEAGAALATLYDEYGNWYDARSALRSLATDPQSWRGFGLVDLQRVPRQEGTELLSASQQQGQGWFTLSDTPLIVEPSGVLPGGFRLRGQVDQSGIFVAGVTPATAPVSGQALRLRGEVFTFYDDMIVRSHAGGRDAPIVPFSGGADPDLVHRYDEGGSTYQVQIRVAPGGSGERDIHIRGLSLHAYDYAPTPLPPTTAPPHPPVDVRVSGSRILLAPWKGADYDYTRITYDGRVADVGPGPDDYGAIDFDAAAAFGYSAGTAVLATHYPGRTSATVEVDIDTGVPPAPALSVTRTSQSAVLAESPGVAHCNVVTRYRVAGGAWQAAGGTPGTTLSLSIETSAAIEVQVQAVDVRSVRASEWSAPVRAPAYVAPDASYPWWT